MNKYSSRFDGAEPAFPQYTREKLHKMNNAFIAAVAASGERTLTPISTAPGTRYPRPMDRTILNPRSAVS
jgi:hypothetical protein